VPEDGDVSLMPTDVSWEGEVSPWFIIGSGYLRQMSEYPIPHREQ
jgi:hypothetical protein